MPAPQTPPLISLLSLQDQSISPVSEWIQLIRTEKEYRELLLAVQGVPPAWLEWAEERVKAASRRGIEINSRIGYALSILWNGITLLQECKFLCDVFENALRTGFVHWVSVNQLSYAQLSSTIPGWGELVSEINHKLPHLLPPEPATIFQPRVVGEFTFYQLTETMARNWKRVRPGNSNCRFSPKGFCTLFRHDPHCRDVSMFQRHMKAIRQTRNDVAHSRRLLSIDEVKNVYHLIGLWLKPLNVELMRKIVIYRNNRPNFLRDLGGV